MRKAMKISGAKLPIKEEGPARGDLGRPTRREFRCLIYWGSGTDCFLGKSSCKLGGDHICWYVIYEPSLR